ncbi:uncharacterized protein HKW66_Vig0045250 [Vigna angularis]|uniref:Uncharacterized protein n=1 Tax=Phaseolus angularis TaxID=3914 RepID=A0A8T0KY30_PHAAN|nr:uncharacterized protein HKW66_Vig0045250 [Vigna angularis]
MKKMYLLPAPLLVGSTPKHSRSAQKHLRSTLKDLRSAPKDLKSTLKDLRSAPKHLRFAQKHLISASRRRLLVLSTTPDVVQSLKLCEQDHLLLAGSTAGRGRNREWWKRKLQMLRQWQREVLATSLETVILVVDLHFLLLDLRPPPPRITVEGATGPFSIHRLSFSVSLFSLFQSSLFPHYATHAIHYQINMPHGPAEELGHQCCKCTVLGLFQYGIRADLSACSASVHPSDRS